MLGGLNKGGLNKDCPRTMARFVLIDHSLTGVDGHHFEYDVNVAKSAEASGYEPVLVTNAQFEPPEEIGRQWTVVPLFAHSSYNHYTVFCGAGSRPPDFRKPLATPWRDYRPGRRVAGFLRDLPNRYWDWKYARRRRRRIRSFDASCRRWWGALSIRQEDILFFPTMTEFDLECLTEFLASTPETRDFVWHLQFHFNFLEGREPDYGSQAFRTVAMRDHFARQFARIPEHTVYRYATSEPLAEQYNQLAAGRFESIPYPVNPRLGGITHRPRPLEPLRVTCAGCVRPEKGYGQFAELVDSLWDDGFGAGRLQLIVQSSDSAPRVRVPDRNARRGAPEPVRRVPFPLPRREYMELVAETDIGLFLYDNHRYYTRCSGVLVEMLAAGVPVVVPAGCWLAEQLADSIHAYQADLINGLTPEALHRRAHIRLSQAADSERLDTVLAVPRGATHLVVRASWEEPSSGRYIRIVAESSGDAPNGTARRETVIGPWRMRRGVPTPAIIPVPPSAVSMRVSVEIAYGAEPIQLAGLDVTLGSIGDRMESIPLGHVGAIASSPREFSHALREVFDHYPHYVATARAFARTWKALHDPGNTVRALRANAARARSGSEARDPRRRVRAA